MPGHTFYLSSYLTRKRGREESDESELSTGAASNQSAPYSGTSSGDGSARNSQRRVKRRHVKKFKNAAYHEDEDSEDLKEKKWANYGDHTSSDATSAAEEEEEEEEEELAEEKQ